MALTEAQLLMLNNLIYTDFVSNDRTVNDIIVAIEKSNYNINTCEMTTSEWKELISMIKAEPTLLDYKITNYCDYKETGMRVACFVNDENSPTDVNVVFRGSSGDYEWKDNGKGGYLSDTELQQDAAEYINNLPDNYGNNMTVTGHSKGGNKAQYVTIVTDRIGKCVSYDGQGFSEEFLEKYSSEIAAKSDKIISISANKDYVHCLLYPIAGTAIYIDAENQNNYLHYHKPNILFDDSGSLRPQIEESEFSKLINEYSTYIISNLEEPERSKSIDGIIEVVIGGISGDDEKLKEAIIKNLAAEKVAIENLDNFAFDYIGKNKGLAAEFFARYIAVLISPKLFADDFIDFWKKIIESINDSKNETENTVVDFTKINESYELTVTPESLISTADEMEHKITQLYSRFSEVTDTVKHTSSYWIGSSADKHRNLYLNNIDLIKQKIEVLNIYAEKLKSISGNYTETENENVDTASDLPIDIIV